jgi:hypothetical protein
MNTPELEPLASVPITARDVLLIQQALREVRERVGISALAHCLGEALGRVLPNSAGFVLLVGRDNDEGRRYSVESDLTVGFIRECLGDFLQFVADESADRSLPANRILDAEGNEIAPCENCDGGRHRLCDRKFVSATPPYEPNGECGCECPMEDVD